MKRAPENLGGDCNRKKINLNNIFHEGKGHFATGEWAFFVFSENLGGLGPLGHAGSYAPDWIKLLAKHCELCLTL
jgi:hypothetical protein